jgi:5-carboxymethyl-2-hydroxymuconate isomerase
MPLITLEYTDNLKDWDPTDFLTKAHQKLAADFGYDLGKIASRAYVVDKYVLGDGNPDLALVLLSAVVGAAHTQEELQTLREWMTSQMQSELKPFATGLKIKTGCSTVEASHDSYTWAVMSNPN